MGWTTTHLLQPQPHILLNPYQIKSNQIKTSQVMTGCVMNCHVSMGKGQVRTPQDMSAIVMTAVGMIDQGRS